MKQVQNSVLCKVPFHALFNETNADLNRQMTSIHSQLCAIDSIASPNEEIMTFVGECGLKQGQGY